jgi:uncharacterized protein (DUF58 family)
MTPTPRAALVVAAVAICALVLPPAALVALLAAALGVILGDALFARRPPRVHRDSPATLARGVPGRFELRVDGRPAGTVELRQPLPPDLLLRPASRARGLLRAELVAARRGRHVLPAAAVRATGPLGLGAWTRSVDGDTELVVFPDLPAARRIAAQVRRGRFRDEGLRRRGPLGLGTEFESVRDYSPDDDIRQVNWRATARLGRPMSNQYRVERDRDVVCVVDCGRLMAAPVSGRTRLDAAIDAAVAVAAVADVLGDRCGTIAFDSEVRRALAPRRAGADAVVQALFDLEPRSIDSDYELAFQHVGEAKRALVLVFTDLLEESAARPLVDALPVLARRHAVAVVTAGDPELEAILSTPPVVTLDVYRAAATLDVLDVRTRLVARLRSLGSDVVDAQPDELAAASVSAYLRAKSRARF